MGLCRTTKLHDFLDYDKIPFDMIQASSFDALWFWKPHKPQEGWRSDSFWKLLGYDTATRPDCSKVIYPDDHLMTLQHACLHIEDNDYPYDVAVRFYKQDGSIAWLHSRGKAVYDENNQVIGLFGTYVNVTHLHQQSDDVVSDESLDKLLHHEDIYVVTILQDGIKSNLRPSVCNALGLDSDDSISQSFLYWLV